MAFIHKADVMGCRGISVGWMQSDQADDMHEYGTPGTHLVQPCHCFPLTSTEMCA